MAALCAFLVNTSHPCDIAAIGRCVQCSRAFCMSHQGYEIGGRRFANLCLDHSSGAVASQSRSPEALRVSQEKLRAEQQRLSDLIGLLAGSVKPVEQRKVAPGPPLRRAWRGKERYRSGERTGKSGWPIGPLAFEHSEGSGWYAQPAGSTTVPAAVSADGQIFPIELVSGPAYYMRQSTRQPPATVGNLVREALQRMGVEIPQHLK